MKTEHLLGLDIYRIILAIIILAFHSNIHFGCNYGYINDFISMGAVSMTGFFLLSGYSNYHVYIDKPMYNIKEIKKFYLKKAIGILPTYYLTGLLYIIFLSKESLRENILLVPMQMLGVQSVFPATFSLSHNSGTWFISCILLAYLIFPYCIETLKQLTLSNKICISILFVVILLYAPVVVGVFSLGSIYANPFFRIIEFLIGMLSASLMNAIKKNNYFKFLFYRGTIAMEWVIMILGVIILYKLEISRGNYMLYSWVCLPIFILIIVSMAGTNSWGGVNIVYQRSFHMQLK